MKTAERDQEGLRGFDSLELDAAMSREAIRIVTQLHGTTLIEEIKALARAYSDRVLELIGPSGWMPIGSARFVAAGTVADLKMPGGRVVRAAWRAQGLTTAWWVLGRKTPTGRWTRPIGLYEPTEWRIVPAVIAMPASPSSPPRK